MSATLATLYRAIRRLHVMDVTCLLHATSEPSNGGDDARIVHAGSDGLSFRAIGEDELQQLRRESLIDSTVGTGIAHTNRTTDHGSGDQWLYGVWKQDCVIAFVWAATGYIPASENYSRSVHLGSSLTMPPHCGFLFNAWTDPEHRGRGLMAALLRKLTVEDALNLNLHDWFATTDWTNIASQRTFQKSGFERVGRLYRLGRGRMQASLVPDLERRMKATLLLDAARQKPRIASDAPGLRWSL
ncbi:GNAT family N-acetyltransferase [Rhodopirellula bahusiensis]|uniref:GNAT family N-acetyltransferase n=1 Tax=Rhodopirellula bahusiensis TaxID=2014065 RepID=A0A2G1VYH1_9BACT|nr:GNAT family N-acetyltransferase [Rhodopirellula bahusiensis]PHQ31817.1 GNAT family N-acetyltransferase [Rhodopirellula bahusiensis]